MENIEDQIIYDYLHGSTFKDLMKKYCIWQRQIEKVLDKNNIKRYSNSDRSVLKKVNYKYTVEELADLVAAEYNKGKGQISSGAKWGLSPNNVKYLLNLKNIKIRNFSEAASVNNVNRKQYNNNPTYFQTQSANMAWVLGFIAADGSIRRQTNQISIRLAAVDEEILHKIKNEVGIEANVYHYTTNDGFNCVGLTWTDRQHKIDLAKYNITYDKSKKLTPPDILDKKYHIDYIRGYFDGDGSINLIKNSNGRGVGNLRWQVCSMSKPILEFIVNTLYESYNIPKVNILSQKRVNHPLYYFQYSSRATRQIYEVLYTPDSIFLKRKKEHFEEVLDAFN